jgi:hypothetical protein
MDKKLQFGELAAILLSEENEAYGRSSAEQNQILTDEDLEKLLDRSAMALQSKEEGTAFKVLEEAVDEGDLLAEATKTD